MSENKQREFSCFFGNMCLALIALWIILTVIYLLQPDALSPGISFPGTIGIDGIKRFWSAGPNASVIHIMLHVMAIITAIFMIVQAKTLSPAVKSLYNRVGEIVLYISQFIQIVSNIRYLSMEKAYSNIFPLHNGEISNLLVSASLSLPIDPYGVFEFGGVGIWVLSIMIFLRIELDLFPLFLLSGAITTIGFFCMVTGTMYSSWLKEIAPFVAPPALCLWLFILYINRRKLADAAIQLA